MEFTLDINGFGNAYTTEESPFWLHSNKRGRIDETANFSTWANGSARTYFNNDSFMEVGMGLLFQDGYIDRLRFDESYIRFQNSWLIATAGRKQEKELYRGLSASNANIAWSLNSRPLLGVRIETAEPIFFVNDHGLGFTASFAEYIMDDDRYVKDTRVHHKSFNLVYKSSGNFQLSAGLQQYAQWAGTSPEYGKLNSSFKDYLNVFLGLKDDVDGREENAAGNQIGVYEVKLNTEINDYKIELIYNHLFEDGSGRMLYNTPDGRYGIYVEDMYMLSENSWIKAIMYELYYTMDQSEGSGTTDGEDNYFVHNLYKSGWTYENKVIGVPFITMNEERTRVYNNTLIAHHLAFTGVAFNEYLYKFMASYRSNYGYKGNDVLDNTILSTFLDAEVYNSDNFIIDIQLGADFISDAPTNLGAGVKLSKKLY
ncbi:capsule assembly Wzi family protein [Zunongwangia sp. F363]|uniref:Capsule assembly Wzi family protein n=1 Tax=Autumnicola tepida TaxID=3075595 RepID=A0ABU3CE01_9FLAO|nr:capsule assembly Wzi family protein [Zunongwangia sp. F363]MDT0644569.1 capsule assembly Wzi family protein [Zunongwangia sp. F363]